MYRVRVLSASVRHLKHTPIAQLSRSDREPSTLSGYRVHVFVMIFVVHRYRYRASFLGHTFSRNVNSASVRHSKHKPVVSRVVTSRW